MSDVLFEGTAQELRGVGKEEINGIRIDTLLHLARVAVEAKANSYAPYSHFNVGAAGWFENKSGGVKMFAGANQENVAHSPTQCGETVMIAQARYQGYHRIKALAVCGGLDSSFPEVARESAKLQWVAPCGRCRQVICETAADNCLVALVRGDGQIMIVTFVALLPFSFGPKNLGANPMSYRP